MTQTQYDKDELYDYEKLQVEYKKLFSEYEDIKSKNPQDPLLDKKVKELTEKHKEIQELSSKLTLK